ncbi:MAG: acyl-CoA dehydrogenase [Thermoprotei archaeon]|nr:MAG: acyl-CoA dehydrogenase [Thermoprotei archaeon]
MDFRLTEEQQLFKETVRRFVENEVKPVAAKIDETDEFPEDLWWKFADMGFFGLRYPEEYGGSNCDVLTFCIFCEEVARGSLAVAFQVTMQAFQSTDFIAKYGDEEIKEQYLVPAIKGKKRGAFSVTEPEAGSDLGNMQTTAVRDGDYFVLNGSKTWCTGAPYADFFIIGAMTDKSKRFWGIDFFLVDRDTPGFKVGRHIPKFGMRGLKEAELSLENVRIPAKRALAGTGVGGKYLQGILAEIRVVTGALALGVTEAALEEALSYAKQRVCFGRPIGRFQSIAHKLATLHTELEAAKLMVYWAAWLLDQKGRESPEAVKPAAMAKNFACELAMRAVDAAWKIHGALGFSSEMSVNRFFRDAGGLYLGGGTTEINNDIIARELGLYG